MTQLITIITFILYLNFFFFFFLFYYFISNISSLSRFLKNLIKIIYIIIYIYLIIILIFFFFKINCIYTFTSNNIDWLDEKIHYTTVNFTKNVRLYLKNEIHLTIPELIFAKVYKFIENLTLNELIAYKQFLITKPKIEVSDLYMRYVCLSYWLSQKINIIKLTTEISLKMDIMHPFKFEGFNLLRHFDPNILYINLYIKNLCYEPIYQNIIIWKNLNSLNQVISIYLKKIILLSQWNEHFNLFQKQFLIGNEISHQTWEKICNSNISKIWSLEYKLDKVWVIGPDWEIIPDWNHIDVLKIANVERIRVEDFDNLQHAADWTEENSVIICAPCDLTVKLADPNTVGTLKIYNFTFPETIGEFTKTTLLKIEILKQLLNKDIIIICIDQQKHLLNLLQNKINLYQLITSNNIYIPRPFSSNEILNHIIKIVELQLKDSTYVFAHMHNVIKFADQATQEFLTKYIHLIAKNWAEIMLRWKNDSSIQLMFLTTDMGIFCKFITQSFYTLSSTAATACLIGAPHEMIRPVCMKALMYENSVYIPKFHIIEFWANLPFPGFAKGWNKDILENNFKLIQIPTYTKALAHIEELTKIEKLNIASTTFFENIEAEWQKEWEEEKIAEKNDFTFNINENNETINKTISLNEILIKKWNFILQTLSKITTFFLFLFWNIIYFLKWCFLIIVIFFITIILIQIIMKFIKNIYIFFEREDPFSKKEFRYRGEIINIKQFYDPRAPIWHINRWRFRDGTLWIDHVFFKHRFIKQKAIYDDDYPDGHEDKIPWFPIKFKGEIIYTNNLELFMNSLK